MFCVALAYSPTISGPYEVLPGATSDNLWPHSLPKYNPTNSTRNHSWVENPIVAQVRGGWVATWDYVAGGGQESGTELPYLGFSWSSDGIHWPSNQSQLVSVLPDSANAADAETMWTDLVRTPTGLIDRGGGTYELFYAARDTRNTSKPYLNCSGTPSCYWGIGKLTVRITLPGMQV